MAAIEHFGELKNRKEALLVESELNRLVLQLEVNNLRTAATRLESRIAGVRSAWNWLLPLAPVVGMFAGRRLLKSGGRRGWLRLAAGLIPALLRWRAKSRP